MEEKHSKRALIRDIILGGQDGLVNVLGVILAVATATNDRKIVIISGLAATFAESISMAAVAYTSIKAADDYYQHRLSQEQREIEEKPDEETREIRDIYRAKGFRGGLLSQIVRKITSNKKLWLEEMMSHEHQLFAEDYSKPVKSAVVVGAAALAGSFIPLIPFMLADVKTGIILAIVFSIGALFCTGAATGKLTGVDWKANGAIMALVGMGAAIAGYAIGYFLGAVVV